MGKSRTVKILRSLLHIALLALIVSYRSYDDRTFTSSSKFAGSFQLIVTNKKCNSLSPSKIMNTDSSELTKNYSTVDIPYYSLTESSLPRHWRNTIKNLSRPTTFTILLSPIYLRRLSDISNSVPRGLK